MKKIICFLFFINILNASSIDKFILENIKTDVNEEIEKLNVEKTKKLYGSFYRPKFTPSISFSHNKNKNDKNESIFENQILGDIDLSYGWFNYNLSLDLKNKEITSHKISFSTKINDFLYNFIKENNLEYEIEKNNIYLKNDEKIEEILNYYSKYILKKYELSILEDEKELINKEILLLDSKLKNGNISKNEYRNLKDNIEIENINKEILQEEFEILKIELEEKGIDINKLPSFEFEFLEKENIIKNVENKHKIKNYEIAKKEIEYQKHISSKMLPDITMMGSYNIMNNNYSLGVNISKTFDFTTDEIKELIKMKKDIENISKNSNIILEKSKKIKINEYEKLKLSYILALKRVKNLEKTLEVDKIKYNQGNEKLIKIIETRKELNVAKMNLKNSEISLSIFNWLIKRGE